MNSFQLENAHTGVTTSCAVMNDGSGRILTGGEGGEIFMWSPQGQKIGHIWIDENVGEPDVNSIYPLKKRPEFFYATCGSEIFLFDSRALSSDPVQRLFIHQEDISQVVVNEKEEFMATCDDDGVVKIYNLVHDQLYKTLKKHSNICSAICFRPDRPWDLFSVSYDKRLITWDFARAKTLCDLHIDDVGASADIFDPNIINPSFIHCLGLSPNGNYLAVGTEGSVVKLFDTTKRTPLYLTTLTGHSNGVSQVLFPDFDHNIFLSAANDGIIKIWDATSFPTEGHQHTNGHPAKQPAQGDSSDSDHGPVEIDNIEHGNKINWMCAGSVPNRNFIVISSCSSTPTVYDLPFGNS